MKSSALISEPRVILLALICVLAPLTALPTAVAGDSSAGDALSGNLFSKITMSETVGQTAVATQAGDEKSSTILGAISLSKLFLADQIQVNVQSQTVSVPLADLLPISASMPTVKDATLKLSVDAEANRIDVWLPVRVIGNESSINGSKMLELMAELASHSNIQLTVADQSLAFHTSLVNQSVTTDQIRTVVRQAVVAAANMEPMLASIDNKLETEPDETKPAAPATSPAPTARPVSSSIVGTWSAKTSATDAWAIRLAGDGSFVMVHTRSGTNSVSRGQYTINQSRLTLSESGGVTLKGTLDRTSQKQFSWNLQDDNGKTLTTLAFSKQS